MPVRKEGLRELLEECHKANASVYRGEVHDRATTVGRSAANSGETCFVCL